MFRLTPVNSVPEGWLAFELSVLRRLAFASVALPFTGEPTLGAYLKRWGVRVLANDALQSAWARATAGIQNNADYLTEEHVAALLENTDSFATELYNPGLRQWFNPADALWFDRMRTTVETFDSPIARAIALSIGMGAGDYVLSFDQRTIELRQPLPGIFRRLWNTFPPPINNSKNNVCTNREAREFVAETLADLMFLRLPQPHNNGLQTSLGWTAWREEWIGGSALWRETLERAQAGRLGARVETKHQYLKLVEDFLLTAAHLPKWAIAHQETGFVTTAELIEVIARVRPVETVYSKDFSELTGVRAAIIIA